MDRFTNDILKEIREGGLIDPGSTVLCGFSGGADSVCLLQVLYELRALLKIELKAVHVNHGIRGEEADRDEAFCRDFSKKLGIELVVKHVDVPAYVKETGLSEEEAARVLRYKAFSEIPHDIIAVAHHADDQAETVLFNMLRGSALKGAGGIRLKRDDIVRPMLHKDRKAILEYIDRKHLSYVTDSTNLCNDHTRNYLRNAVLPGLSEKVNNKASEHIVRFSEYVREADDYLREEARQKMKGLVVYESVSSPVLSEKNRQSDKKTATSMAEEETRAYIDRKAVKEMPQILRRYVIIEILERLCIPLKDLGEKHIEDVDKAILGTKGHHADLPGSVYVENTAKHTMIVRHNN